MRRREQHHSHPPTESARPQEPPRRPSRQPRDRDAALVQRIGTGDIAAFEDAVLTHAAPLVAFAWRYLGSADAASDVVQDVFAHLWEQRGELAIRGALRAYLYAAVRNRALNTLAHSAVEARWRDGTHLTLFATSSTPVAADVRLERAELADAVRAALRALPPRGREIARLRWIDGMSPREIAEILGIAVPTVSIHLTRTAKRLRTLLAGVRR